MRSLTILIVAIVSVFASAGTDRQERFYRNIAEMGDYGDLTVNCIYRDSTGFVWMGSDKGVLRCDGVHTHLIPVDNDKQPLFITSFESLPDNEIAVGTRHGLIIIDSRGDVKHVGDKTDDITSLVRWSADTLLAGTAHGLLAYDRDGSVVQFASLPASNIYQSGPYVVCMDADSNGNVYVHTQSVLYRIDRCTGDIVTLRQLADEEEIPIAMVVGDDCIWVASASSGVTRVDVTDGSIVEVKIPSPVITSVSLGPDGLYVGTDGDGVYLVDVNSLEVIAQIAHILNQPGSPASSQVYSVYADDTGILWMGYYQHGADYSISSRGVFVVFNEPDVFNSRGIAIRTITIEDDFRAIGMRDGIILKTRDGKMRRLHRPELNSDMVIAVKSYRDRLYIGTYGGGMSVYSRADGRVSDFDVIGSQAFKRGHVFTIAVDSADNLWFGTGDGVYCYDGNSIVLHFTSTNSTLPDGNVYEIMFDSRGRGWICTENGMCIYDPVTRRLRTDMFPDNFKHNEKIRKVYEDSDHNLYFVPERGVVKMSTLSLDYTLELSFAALDGADIKGIIEDENGYIWMTSNRGAARWNKKNEILKFGLADGLPSVQFIQCTPAMDGEGNLWFGNSEGLLRVDIKSEPHNEAIDHRLTPTSVVTEGGYVNRATILQRDSARYEIRLDKFCSNLEVDFSPFTYTTPDAITYEYSLDGKSWTTMPYSLNVNIYNSFSDYKVTFMVRPKGNESLLTWVDIMMPMSIALKFIIGLGIVALLLTCYVIYVNIVRLRNVRKAENGADDVALEDGPKAKYRSNPINDHECSRIMKAIDSLMEKEKPYTDPELKISQLAGMVNISSHRLSQVFNQYVNMRFYDYVNHYRVREFKKLASHGGASRYTLTAMAEKAGFSSRASFFRHFKEIEGISPGEYLRNLKSAE